MTKVLERAQMTGGFFRLIMLRFGEAPDTRGKLLEGTGVDDDMLADHGAEISLFQQLRQLDNTNALLGPGWPLDAPELWGAASHGRAGLVALTAPNVGVMLETLTRYARFHGPFAARRLVKAPDAWRLELDPAWPLENAQWRALTEANFLSLRALFTGLLGRPARGVSFAFTGPAPSYLDRVRELLGPDVSYGEPVAYVRIPTAEVRQPAPLPDAALHAQLVSELDRLLARAREPDRLRVEVERMLATMPHGRLSAPLVARAMSVSERTFVRRLAEAGTSFRNLLDDEMRHRARRMLDASKLRHSEIAEQLGYGDASSFSRACRRWFGGKFGASD